MATVRIFTKQFCPGCRMTERLLDELGVDYQEIDVSNDPDAVTALQSLGYRSVPIVLVENRKGEVTGWTGFRPDKIKQLFNS